VGDARVISVALLSFSAFFFVLLAHGLVSGRMPSRFGAAIRGQQPIRFYLNGALIAFFAVVCMVAGLQGI
jgi:hypothetical protein